MAGERLLPVAQCRREIRPGKNLACFCAALWVNTLWQFAVINPLYLREVHLMARNIEMKQAHGRASGGLSFRTPWLNPRGSRQLAMNSGNPLDLTFGRETLVKTIIAEVPYALGPWR